MKNSIFFTRSIICFSLLLIFSSSKNFDYLKLESERPVCGQTVHIDNQSTNATVTKIEFRTPTGTFIENNIGPGQTLEIGIYPGQTTVLVTLANQNSGSIKIYQETTSGNTLLQCEDYDNTWSFYPVAPYSGNCATVYRVVISDVGC